MSVLIKGWTIPKGCADCPTWCKLYLQKREFRHPDCPLIEVPTPHGRLIDADKLTRDTIYNEYITETILSQAETVVEADNEVTE